MNLFTEIALISADKIIVPLMADEFSKAALRNMFYLLYGLGREERKCAVASYENTMFFS